MSEIDFNELKIWQKVVCIFLFILIGWGMLYISDLYFSALPIIFKKLLFAIGWFSCSVGTAKPLFYLFNILNKKEK
jgi:hypothetical protein